jgi:hypothetical protein
LLLAAASFLFLYNLSEYAATSRQYKEAREHYQGVLTVEEEPVSEQVDARFSFFLLTDETNPGRTWDRFTYDEYHHKSLNKETIETLSALPYISRVEKRYMTAGVSADYLRLDMDQNYFAYNSRLILEATLAGTEPYTISGNMVGIRWFDLDACKTLALKDVKLLAGDPEQLKRKTEIKVDVAALSEDFRDSYTMMYLNGGFGNNRSAANTLDLGIFREDIEALEIGRRYIFVLRGVNPWTEDHFVVGDDSRIGWWPYFTDVTDLPENYLETDGFADLRELIQVTEDDLHTFDVVYGDDMESIPRVSEGRMICMDGRFLTPADAGQPVCVVSTGFLETYGLKVGDGITLELGNYLCEQYAPLGAVASTRGRYSALFQNQTFTIVGAYLDLNEGKHVNRDFYWCWSNNAVFVPSAFLPDCVNADSYTFKPAEVSFVVGNAEDILPFQEECLSIVDTMNLTYTFSDGGWLKVGKELIQARDLALMKVLIFAGAAIFALVLTIWLFVTRKKREYGILRALGMGKGESSGRLFFPLVILGAVSAVLGALIAYSVTLSRTQVSASPLLFLLGGLAFFVLLLLLSWCGIMLLWRKSILELVQEEKK